MFSTILRIWFNQGTSQEEIKKYLSRISKAPYSTQQEGMKNSKGEMSEFSGCSIEISEIEDMDLNLHEIESFLDGSKAIMQEDLQQMVDPDSGFDIGITVGSTNHFTRSIQFEPKLLAKIAAFKFKLTVSSYPSGED